MKVNHRKSRFTLAVVTMIAGILAGSSGMAMAAKIEVALSGDQEVPPVSTSAKGSGTITVGADKSVSGSVTTSGVAGVAAHIHEGAPGENGPVVIFLTKTSGNVWSVPAGTKLTDAQYLSFEAGKLYFNVHSEAHKKFGEIRGQIKP